MTAERRQSPRRRLLRRGRVVFRDGYGVIDCVVLDLSDGGARLKIGAFVGLPSRFELRIENGPSYRAEACHRSVDFTSVRFLESPA